MAEQFKWVHLDPRDHRSDCSGFGLDSAEKVNAYHKSFPEYTVTPLAKLDSLASSLGLNSLYVKDESYRFGLNAFKVLGGSFAIGSYIAGLMGADISEMPFERLVSDEIKEKLGAVTFVTATDGNHGRGVAWTANRLGQKSVVYMPQGTAPERLNNIRLLGSDANVMDMNYDDCVRLAKTNAEKNGWVVVQDTAWDGYEDIPLNIMKGYTTMALEALRQLDGKKPTHIFLQAGVGSMAGAISAFFADYYGDDDRPLVIIVEPNKADCHYKTAKANDGKLHFCTGDINSIMAGLSCGEPCPISWEILRDHADFFVSMPDYVAEVGMRALGRPLCSDPKVISGESGASTAGLVCEIMKNPDLKSLKDELGMDENSCVLCFSTEGDTDKESYRRILEV